MSTSTIAFRSLELGAVAGLRSMMAPAAAFSLRDRRVSVPLALLAAGELIADKLPVTPSRLAPPSLGFRLASGALCGWVVAGAFDGNRPLGLVCGAVGAAAASYGGYYLRQAIVKNVPLPDTVVAIGEDGLALAFAAIATRRGA
jgi:uncharacterized membrane protein